MSNIIASTLSLLSFEKIFLIESTKHRKDISKYLISYKNYKDNIFKCIVLNLMKLIKVIFIII